jgi:hypothetical protein
MVPLALRIKYYKWSVTLFTRCVDTYLHPSPPVTTPKLPVYAKLVTARRPMSLRCEPNKVLELRVANELLHHVHYVPLKDDMYAFVYPFADIDLVGVPPRTMGQFVDVQQ